MAEAFYGGVPKEMAKKVLEKVPVAFKRILDAMAKHTAYGKRCPGDRTSDFQ